jgi:hypothetical protein
VQGTTRAQRPSAAQRRAMAAAHTLLGAEVRAYAAGRAEARMSRAAGWTIGITAGIWLAALVVLHVILLPGALVCLVLYDMIRPRRGVAVTDAGVAELSLRGLNAMPKSAIAVVGPDALSNPEIREGSKVGLRFPEEVVTMHERDFAWLVAAAAAVGAPSLPPPPGATSWEGSSSRTLVDQADYPRWRRATIAMVLCHFLFEVFIFLGIILVANVVTELLGRDPNRTRPSANVVLWFTYAGVVVGWYLFVYWRRSDVARRAFLAVFVGGALLLTCIVNVAMSPAR